MTLMTLTSGKCKNSKMDYFMPIDSSEENTNLLTLDSPDATLELVGGKGASLARLAVAGLPVPPGFHITTHAYRRFVSANRLAEAILAAAARARADDPTTLDLV